MLSRTLLRRPAPVRSMLQQRFASSSSSSSSSSTSAATEQAAQKASDVAAKAKSVAGPAIEKVQQASAKAQALVGNALGAYKEPIFYNAAVAKEIVKQVYVKEKLAPPSLGQVTYVYQQFFNSARDVNYWQQLYKSGEWKRWAIYAVEAYGIFKIGEMIGRRHVVGYKLEGELHLTNDVRSVH
ncbi:BZ3500_MvSof-1268-A1-R1_Chr6-3g08817 [Microbotryum saponariae]|uniref:BZ3500_MvSof-1268-A1-R1_Chr6-3g08817 protein n=1 Tax=Microbotryum saponariae TaxID=289078 RepID=A0A2X0MHD1_9BASI|nr:BZ3500_MvSof-1268-A1-R1_Chr6-3g08817 [Microbotryum saponariae]